MAAGWYGEVNLFVTHYQLHTVDPTSEATSVQRTRITFLEEEEEEEDQGEGEGERERERRKGSEDENMENEPKYPQFQEEEDQEGKFTGQAAKQMGLNQKRTEMHPHDRSADVSEQMAPCEIDPDNRLPQTPSPSHLPASTPQSQDKAMDVDAPEGRQPSHLNTKPNHDQGAASLQVAPRRSGRDRRPTSDGSQKQDISVPRNPRKRMSKTRPTNNSRPKQSATKKQRVTTMEEAVGGDIREKILIDLTINDLQADMVSTAVVNLRNASSGVTGRAPAKVVGCG